MSQTKLENLALAVHKGLDGAMEKLVRAYQDQLYGYALRMLQNRFDAQEVTQDAFLRAYQALSLKYDEARCRELALRPWLLRITRNLANNRRRARHALPEEPLEKDYIRAPIPDGGMENVYESQGLHLALARLKPGRRELVVLRFLEGLPYREIARVLGITEVSARGKVFRALRELKRLASK